MTKGNSLFSTHLTELPELDDAYDWTLKDDIDRLGSYGVVRYDKELLDEGGWEYLSRRNMLKATQDSFSH